jgi:subtilisin family serine protease
VLALLLGLPAGPLSSPPPALAGALVIHLAPGAAPLVAAPLGATAPVRAEPPLAPLALQSVRVPAGAEAAFAARLRRLPGIRAVEPVARVQAAALPNDPYYADYQWNLRQIRAPEAWDLTTGDRRVIVAIVDTGIALDHPDLADKLVPGINFVTPGQPPQDDNGHGTHVAGIVAAATNNGQGIAGVDWEARLMPVKVLDASGGSDVVRVAQGMVWAVDQGARVLNLSFSGVEPSAALTEAVQYAQSRGVLVVAEVANNGRAEPSYPAALDGVLAVGPLARNEQPLQGANSGSYVAVAAPAEQIASTFWDATAGNVYAVASTPSQAPPHVAGLAGLIWSVNPELRGDAVRALLVNHADDVASPGRDELTGTGRINAYRSVLAALPWHYDSGGAAAYRARAENAPRIFLPYVVKAAGGWTSSITLRNPLPQPVALTVSFVGPNGATVTSVGASLNAFGSTTLPLRLLTEVPVGFQGAAVVDAASGLTAVVEHDRAGASRHGYFGIGSGAARLYAPLVEKGGRRGSSVLHVQNLGDGRESATISYYTGAGALAGQETVTLPPRAALPVRLADTASLAEGFAGAAIVETASGGLLGGVAAQLGSNGEATAYTLPTESGGTLAAPLVFKNARGWSTGLQVLNVGSAPAQVTVTYSRPNPTQAGTTLPQDTATIPPRQRHFLPARQRGAARRLRRLGGRHGDGRGGGGDREPGASRQQPAHELHRGAGRGARGGHSAAGARPRRLERGAARPEPRHRAGRDRYHVLRPGGPRPPRGARHAAGGRRRHLRACQSRGAAVGLPRLGDGHQQRPPDRRGGQPAEAPALSYVTRSPTTMSRSVKAPARKSNSPAQVMRVRCGSREGASGLVSDGGTRRSSATR